MCTRNRLPDRIEGTGFYLRRWRMADAAWYVAARDDEVFRWTTEKRELTLSETEEAIQGLDARSGAFCFAIAEQWTDEPLGNIVLTLVEGQPGVAEVMYWLAASARGRGIATQAVVLLTDWAFKEMDLRRIVLKTRRGNIRSQKVAERAGFRSLSEAAPSEEDYLWFELVR